MEGHNPPEDAAEELEMALPFTLRVFDAFIQHAPLNKKEIM